MDENQAVHESDGLLERRVLKVKVNTDPAKVYVAFEEMSASETWTEFTMSSTEPAVQEFVDAMQGLAIHLVRICELPDDIAEEVTVRGVSFSYPNGIMGATITGLRALKYANSPLVLNSPFLPSEAYSEGAECPTLSRGCVDALYAAKRCALAYVDGERAVHMELFEGKPDKVAA